MLYGTPQSYYPGSYGGAPQQDPNMGRMLAPYQSRVAPVTAPNATAPPPVSVPPFPVAGGGGGGGGGMGDFMSMLGPALSTGTSLFGMFGGGGGGGSPSGNTQGGQSGGSSSTGGIDLGTIASLASIAMMFV